MRLRYLVTGTGRSGTVYMARLLSSVGIPCGHESVFDWRGGNHAVRRLVGIEPLELSHASQNYWDNGETKPLPTWLADVNQIQAESSYMAAPFLDNQLLVGVDVIHVVRNPVKVIQSFCNYIWYFRQSTPSNRYEEFIYERLPELRHSLPVYDRACLYWLRWNQMVEKCKPAFFHRVESGAEPVLQFLGVSGQFFNDNKVNSYEKPYTEMFSLHKIQSQIIRDEFIAVGKSYGYRMSDYMLM